ncbi:MAG: DoxX family protein [Candidatus Neomarinimicrobiota bacterium]|nr:DoxX family protein [Candidatus Neomarinimicrobiota bacterium]MEC9437537.1 DoxX family protein [Candidatus Neomarinimicrobiota bacterium]
MSQITINRIKIITMYIMSIFYISVGINHFVDPDWFTQIVPPYLSRYDLELVYISGVCEVMFGVLILFKKTRYYAAWGLILTLAAVFPANIYLAQSDGVAMGTSAAIAWYRLPFQSLFIVLAYWHRS